MNCNNKNNIDTNKNNIDTNLNISKLDNIDNSPSPKPLTPKTYEYCTKNLCYAPRIKKKELILDKDNMYTELKLST